MILYECKVPNIVKYAPILLLTIGLLSSGCSTIHGIILRSPSDGRYYVKLEKSDWGVKLPNYNFELLSKRSTMNENGRGLYLHLVSSDLNNLNLSLWIEPRIRDCNSAIECANNMISGKDISVQHSSHKKTYLFDKFAVAEYFLPYWPDGYPPIKGGPNVGDEINQLNMNAFLVKGSFWLDIHISQGVNQNNVENVQNTFKRILREIEIWEPLSSL